VSIASIIAVIGINASPTSDPGTTTSLSPSSNPISLSPLLLQRRHHGRRKARPYHQLLLAAAAASVGIVADHLPAALAVPAATFQLVCSSTPRAWWGRLLPPKTAFPPLPLRWWRAGETVVTWEMHLCSSPARRTGVDVPEAAVAWAAGLRLWCHCF
jgi:hypothetical protein